MAATAEALVRSWEEHLLGDLTLLLKAIGASEFARSSAAFSLDHGISHKAILEVHRLRRQLTREVNRLLVSRNIEEISEELSPPTQTHSLHLRQLAVVAFFDHIARSACLSILPTHADPSLPSDRRLDDRPNESKKRRQPYQVFQG